MLLTFALLACSSPDQSVPTPELVNDAAADSQAAAEVLCGTLGQAAVKCEATGGVARFAEQELTLSVEVVDQQVFAPKEIGFGSSKQAVPGEVKMRFAVQPSLDGQALSALRIEVPGVGNDIDLQKARGAALESALHKWGVGFGAAIADAVGRDIESSAVAALGMPKEVYAVGDFQVWRGYPLIGLPNTGGGPGALSLDPASLVGALEPLTEGLAPEQLHSLRLEVKMEPVSEPANCGYEAGGYWRLDGELYLDGQPTGKLCELGALVKWPQPAARSPYTWEQFFVLR